jgi:hypothetical protein
MDASRLISTYLFGVMAVCSVCDGSTVTSFSMMGLSDLVPVVEDAAFFPSKFSNNACNLLSLY